MPRQLVFELGHRTARGREDFLVAPSNATAVALIDAWPAWPGPTVALSGPQGSGKTHLAEVWREMSAATRIAAGDLASADVPGLVAARAVVVEDIATLSDAAERTLFHLLNLVKGGGRLAAPHRARGPGSSRHPPSRSRLAPESAPSRRTRIARRCSPCGRPREAFRRPPAPRC